MLRSTITLSINHRRIHRDKRSMTLSGVCISYSITTTPPCTVGIPYSPYTESAKCICSKQSVCMYFNMQISCSFIPIVRLDIPNHLVIGLTPTEKTVLMSPDPFLPLRSWVWEGDDKYYGTYTPAGSCTVRRAITARVAANTLRPIAAVSDLAN